MKSIIEPVYQPICDTHSANEIAYLEALARVRGDITRNGHVQLLRLSEQIGFVQQIDLAMLDQVLDVLAQTTLPIAVNLSVHTIDRVVAQIVDRFERHDSLLSRLVIEITETVRITKLQNVQNFIGMARHFGCRIAVDDYGDGHFTLPIVSEIRPDFIKLSPAILGQLYNSGDSDALQPILDVAAECNAELIAEHVDSLPKAVALRRLPIRYVQGFSFGLPGPHPECRVTVGS